MENDLQAVAIVADLMKALRLALQTRGAYGRRLGDDALPRGIGRHDGEVRLVEVTAEHEIDARRRDEGKQRWQRFDDGAAVMARREQRVVEDQHAQTARRVTKTPAGEVELRPR